MFQFCTHWFLVLSKGTGEKHLTPSSSFPLIRHVHTQIRSAPCLLFSQMNSPTFLSLSLYARYILNHLSDLSLNLLQKVYISLVLGMPGLELALQMCLTSADRRRRMTSLHLLATHILMQPRMLLAIFLQGHITGSWSACFTSGHPSSSHRCFSAIQPSPVLVPGITPPQMRNFALPFIELDKILVIPFLHPVQVSLSNNIINRCISYPSQFWSGSFFWSLGAKQEASPLEICRLC